MNYTAIHIHILLLIFVPHKLIQKYDPDCTGEVNNETVKDILKVVLKDTGAPQLQDAEIEVVLKENNLNNLKNFDLETLNLAAQKTIHRSLSKRIPKTTVHQKVKEAFNSINSFHTNSKDSKIPTKDLKEF